MNVHCSTVHNSKDLEPTQMTIDDRLYWENVGHIHHKVFFLILFYCILGFGVHVQNMQDSYIGTHMPVCFASFLPFTHIWHFSPGHPSPAPPPTGLPLFPLIDPSV